MSDLPAHPTRTTDAPERRSGSGAVVAPGVLLNPTALALWELCDGQTTVAEMVAAVAEFFSLDSQRARDDVNQALWNMLKAGVIR